MSGLTALTAEQARYAARGMVVVESLARLISRQWPAVDESDFRSVGHEAVVRAATRFRPDMGVLFESFARHAIWGAMLDLAHRETFIVRRTATTMARALSDPPEDEVDMASWMEDSATSVRDEALRAVRARAADFAAAAFAGGTPALTAEDVLIEQESRRPTILALRTAVAELDEKERCFVHLYYEEELTLDAIAAQFGVVKRTIQRMHDRIKTQLAAALNEPFASPHAEPGTTSLSPFQPG